MRKGGRLLQQLRGYAAQAEVVTAEQSAFLRFGTPYPAQLNMNTVLAQLPETKVGTQRASWFQLKNPAPSFPYG
jgi:hypothetical protein